MKGRIVIPYESKGMWIENEEYRACLRDHTGKTNNDISFSSPTTIADSYKVYFIPLELV